MRVVDYYVVVANPIFGVTPFINNERLITRRLALLCEIQRYRKRKKTKRTDVVMYIHVLTSANATYVNADRVFSCHGTAINRTEIVSGGEILFAEEILISIYLSLSLSLSIAAGRAGGGENGLG